MEKMTDMKRKKRYVSSAFLWLLLFLSTVLFLISFVRLQLFPKLWVLYLAVGLLALLIVTGFFTRVFSKRNVFQRFVNLFLTVCLCLASFVLPYEVNLVNRLFQFSTASRVKINLYIMNDAYRSANASLYDGKIVYPSDDEVVDDVSLYGHAVYGTTLNTDSENQSYALNELTNLCGNEYVSKNAQSITEAVDELYANQTNILILSEAYASTLQDTPGYENFENDTRVLYTIERTIENHTITGDTTLAKQPFTVFIGGNDQTGALSTVGRTDVCMSVTVNPNSHQIAIINMPRDSYIPNPYYNGTKDKLTHLGVVGIENTLKGLGQYLDVDINNYVILNFDTFMAIIDALNGITVDNPYEFTAINGMHFDEGVINLDPSFALMYVRERENLPDGDFGRNMHQQLVMEAAIRKVTTADGILHFNDVLKNLQGNFLTNLSIDAIYGLVNKQLSENIDWNIVKYHVEGGVGMEYCASANAQRLSVVYPYPNQVTFIRNVIDEVIAGDVINQEELPAGSFTKE